MFSLFSVVQFFFMLFCGFWCGGSLVRCRIVFVYFP